MAELTERKFTLKCRLKYYSKTVHDVGRTYERLLCLLVPEQNDEGNLFIMAWAPDTTEEHHEVVGLIPVVNSACRLAVKSGSDAMSEKPYLVVMSVGVEQRLLKHKREGDLIMVEIQGDDEDAENINDNAVDASEGNYELPSGLKG